MAIDPTTILQLLMQGSGSPIRPTSGLQEPSLSGLQLGEQGMGLGGGGSLLGGGGGGLGTGGEGGLGLDIFQLLSQLQGGGGAAPPTALGQGGGTLGAGFGAGGALQPQPGGVPAGTMQAGLGGGSSLSNISSLLKLINQGLKLSPGASPTVGGDTLGVAPFGQSVAGTPAFSGSLGGDATITGGLSEPALNALTGTQAPNLGNVGAQFAAQNAPGVSAAAGLGLPENVSIPALEGFFGAEAPEAAGGFALPSLGQVGTGLGGVAGLGFGLNQALTSPTAVGKAGGATSAVGGALTLASLFQPELLPFAIAASLLGGGTSIFGSLFGGQPSVYDAKRAAAQQGATTGEAGFQSALQQGVTGGELGLLGALGAPGFGDYLGQGRSPMATVLNVPTPQVSALGLPTDLGGNFGDYRSYNFVSGGVTPQLFDTYLQYARTHPEALNWLQGSGDVSYLPQSAAQAVQAQNTAAAQTAIRDFLGLTGGA